MAKRREPYQITNDAPFRTFDLTFDANSVSITNPTPWPVYFVIGGTNKPSRLAFDALIAPFSSYVCDPGNAHQFALFVDNTPSPSLPFTFPVVIVFSTGAADVQAPLSAAIQAVAATGYDAKIQTVVGSALLAFLPLEETAVGTTVAVDLVNAQNWGYSATGVSFNQSGIGDGKPSVLFDGVNGQVVPQDPTLAYLNSHWNPDLGTMAVWLFVTSANMAAAGQPTFAIIGVDASNRYMLYKNAANVVSIFAQRNTVSQLIQNAAYTGNSWVHLAFTWNAALNRTRFYVNGSQAGADGTCTNTFVGSLNNTNTLLANWSGNRLTGNLAKFWIATRELSAAEILNLSIIA